MRRQSLPSELLLGIDRTLDPEMQAAPTARTDEKDQYRTCCAVCHIKFGTTVLGAIELLVSLTLLISAAQQVVWKSGGSQHCSHNFLRDCLIFQFSHFNVTLILDYIVVFMMVFILVSIVLLFCGILSDTSSLLLPHILIQAIFLLFSIGYFGFYAVSYFYGDLYVHSRPFTFNHFIERMWLATLLLSLAAFQTYLFSAVIRCSMYLSRIEEQRRKRETAFERCSERVRLAKENGLWRTTSWGGGFQEYKGQYDESKPKKAPKQKSVHVQWSATLRRSVAGDDETTIKLLDYERKTKNDMHEPLLKLESVDESPEMKPARVGSHKQHTHDKEVTRKRSDQHTHSIDQPSTSKTPAPPTTRPSGPRLEKQVSREGHRRGSTSSTSPHRRKDSQSSVGVVERRRTSSSPRASLKKQKSVDVEGAHPAAVYKNRSSQDSRRSSVGTADHRRSSTTSNQRHQIVAQGAQTQPTAAEKRSEVPHIKRVSISATHL
ncbi:unnamed protein product [Cylicocyclus nassatus]|uniref:Uncharacterized protein n=1 Tax=Cylicocyclus nassatus TaxID=53992 RepID=A0AA36DMB9_CYLNA|nr:unnamed protein product [Cylicocyclus nassatus]